MTTKKMFILLIENDIVIERQVLLDRYQNLFSQSLHNSACVDSGNSPAWCILYLTDSLLDKRYYANVNADAPSLPMNYIGLIALLTLKWNFFGLQGIQANRPPSLKQLVGRNATQN